MAINPDAYEIDPFNKAIPGESLTATPGQAPYERPSKTSSVEQALESVLKGMHEPIRQKSLCNIIEAGMSCETIASSMGMQAFARGIITPDMAELMIPPLVISLVGIAKDNGLENIKVVNNPIEMPVSSEDVSSLMDKTSLDDGGESETNINDRIFSRLDEEMAGKDMETEQGMMPPDEGMSEGFINRDRDSEMMPMIEEQV